MMDGDEEQTGRWVKWHQWLALDSLLLLRHQEGPCYSGLCVWKSQCGVESGEFWRNTIIENTCVIISNINNDKPCSFVIFLFFSAHKPF